MPTLQADNIADLVALTLRELGPNKWTDISYDLQEHVALPKLLKKEKVGFGSGYGFQFNVNVTTSGSARMTGLYETDEVNTTDTMVQGNVPWRHATTNYAFDEREIKMNRSPARIVELVKVKRANSMIDLATLMENQFWGKPATSDNVDDMFGVQYWIVPSATQGFNGTNPSGFSSGAANISSTTYPNWANWTDDYVSVSQDDLITKLRLAAYKTSFKSPVPTPSYNTGDRYGYYTNYDVVSQMERLLMAQNENLGNDVASKDGQTLFRRVPVTAVPKLDADTTDPVYGINWGVFGFVFLEGEYLTESGSIMSAKQHRVIERHTDLTLNLVCRDRRKLFIVCNNA
jgi:hypothetical protein